MAHFLLEGFGITEFVFFFAPSIVCGVQCVCVCAFDSVSSRSERHVAIRCCVTRKNETPFIDHIFRRIHVCCLFESSTLLISDIRYFVNFWIIWHKHDKLYFPSGAEKQDSQNAHLCSNPSCTKHVFAPLWCSSDVKTIVWSSPGDELAEFHVSGVWGQGPKSGYCIGACIFLLAFLICWASLDWVCFWEMGDTLKKLNIFPVTTV